MVLIYVWRIFWTMRFVLILLAAIMTVTSCEKDTPVRYEVGLSADFDIPSGLNTVETHYFLIRNIPVLYKFNADRNGVDTSTIVNVLASRGLMRSVFSDADYNFISRVQVYAVSRRDPTLKREMYYLDFVPNNTGRELKMLSSTTQLREILGEEFIDLEVRLNFRTITTSRLSTRIEFGYAVF